MTHKPAITVSGDKTLGAGDDGTLQVVTAASIITIPKDVFQHDDEIDVWADTSGQVSLSVATGVTLHTLGNKTIISGQHGYVILRYFDNNIWLAYGDLV